MERSPLSYRVRRLGALLLASALWLAASASDALDRFVASPATNPESVAVYIYDLEEGRVLDSHNARKPLIPASIMKTVTIAELFETCGKDYVYTTSVYADGKVRGGVLEGNLVVEGCGDPCIGSDKVVGNTDFPSEIVAGLKRAGITRVLGRVLVNQDYFAGPACPSSWGSGDLSASYGTGSHAFNYRQNASGKSAVKNPETVFLADLQAAMNRAGIKLAGQDLPEGGKLTLVAVHKSPPVDDIMRSCMMRSDNLYAEAFLRTFSRLKGGDGSTVDGAKRAAGLWKGKGIDLTGVNLVDGSGLSRSNRVTAKFIGDILQGMSESPDYASYFPLAGQEGTLKNLLKDSPLESYIAMKTGSMNGIQCYAGYKLDDDYAPTHVIVVIANDMKDRAALRGAVSALLLETFQDSPHLNKPATPEP